MSTSLPAPNHDVRDLVGGHIARAEHEKPKILTGMFGERSHSEDLEVNGQSNLNEC
jgi:hypothetical protein